MELCSLHILSQFRKVQSSLSKSNTKNGHLLFINTGRTKAMMPEEISELHLMAMYMAVEPTFTWITNFFFSVQSPTFCARRP